MSDPNTLENEVQELVNKFAGPNTLEVLSKVIQKELDGKLTLDDVVNKVSDLSSDEYDKPLSARQGKLLKDLIDDIKVCDMDISAEDIVLIKKWIAMNHDEFLTISQLMSTLESDDSVDLTTKVASVALVKTINAALTLLINELTERVESLENEKGTLQETVSNLQSTVGELQSSNEELQSKNEELEGKISGFESQIESVTQENESLKGRVDSLESAKESLESQIQELQEELDSFEEMTEEEVHEIWDSAKESLANEDIRRVQVMSTNESVHVHTDDCEEDHMYYNDFKLKWDEATIQEFLNIYENEGASVAAEHFSIQESTAETYYNRWKK